jgi:hypothetical protein
VRNQLLTTPGKAEYRALVLPPMDAIDANLAEQLVTFAAAGLPILFAGKFPTSAKGFDQNQSNTQRVTAAIDQLRKSANAHFASNEIDFLVQLSANVTPNIRSRSQALPLIQKRIGRANTYFLRNESDAAQTFDVEFEAEGNPELWDPWTGQTSSISGSTRNGKWVRVHFDLEPCASALIVFNPDGTSPAASGSPVPRKLQRFDPIGEGGWKFTATGLIPSTDKAVIQRDLPQLIDWSLDSELRGFSGRGTYTTEFTVSAANPGGRLILDLGSVRDVAEVTVNGKHVANLLLRPYQIDVTDTVQSGKNLLEVSVTNTLYNCMILREPRTFRPGSAENINGLMPSGLIGPVQIKVMT